MVIAEHTMRTRIVVILAACLFLGTLLSAGCSGDKKQAIRTGDTLAPFSGTDLQGSTFSLATHREKPVIVRFFLIDCPYCKADTPIFNKFYEKYHDKGLEIVYINNNGADAAAVKNFVDDLEVHFPVIYDPKGDIAKKYNIKLQPLTMILSPEHKLLAALLGGVSEAELNELLSPYFKG